MEIWAHRGRLIPTLHGNTLLDFQEAYELGVSGIETDVCFSNPEENGSQKPIIHHPCGEEEDNFCQKPKLGLDNFLAFMRVHTSLLCLLEPKINSEELIDAIVSKITEYGLEDRIYITVSQMRIPFVGLEVSTKLIARARSRNPKIKIHIIAMFPFSLPALARKYQPDIISVGWLPDSRLSILLFRIFLMKILNLERQIEQVQKMGIKIIGGIADDKENFTYLTSLGVDGIMTDNSIAAMEFTKDKSP